MGVIKTNGNFYGFYGNLPIKEDLRSILYVQKFKNYPVQVELTQVEIPINEQTAYCSSVALCHLTSPLSA